MRLSELLRHLAPLLVDNCHGGGVQAREELSISSLHYRSQEVRAGGLFVAIAGQNADGHDFIDEAVMRGAVTVISARPVARRDVVSITVSDPRQALAWAADAFYGHPSRDLVIIGITGTNGKTTTSYLVERILQQAGLSVGVIGTINYRYGAQCHVNPVTTPESLDLQRILARMRTAGVTHVVMEISSHAIDLGRIERCWIDVGVFTNLSQDHLDYHQDMVAYWACKQRLFTDYLVSGPKQKKAQAVLNMDQTEGQALSRCIQLPAVTVGQAAGSMVRAEAVRITAQGLAGRIQTPRNGFEFNSPLVGLFNLENILCAVGAASALQIAPTDLKAGLEAVSAVPGRLERIPNQSGLFVYVDYAHTPDALQNVLATLSEIAPGRLVCVFGCGGDRDRQKRPVMGSLAAQMSDLCVVTSDNPRSETPMQIIDDILEGTCQVLSRVYQPDELSDGFDRRGYVVQPDRRAAIALAIQTARSGDTVLIAGKGHEDYQILADRTIAFDDCQEARRALQTKAAAGNGDNTAQPSAKNG